MSLAYTTAGPRVNPPPPADLVPVGRAYQDAASSPQHVYNLAWGGTLLRDEPSGANADPGFQDPDGTVDGNRDDDFWLSGGSPAVDSGNPSVTNRIDILGSQIVNSHVDKGAYEAAP